ncbi:MAG: DNA helicase [Chloroflexi bacterium]|nr:DNA helicase [Chloroflexota bacterium]
MQFRIADTFTDSLGRLTGDEQKAAKTTAFDLQLSPDRPGLQFHKLTRPQDPNFRSVRVNRDIRLIVHRTRSSLLLCYVEHHDVAYRWAERRKIERHPRTGAAQIVELRQSVREIVIPDYGSESIPDPEPEPELDALIFADQSDDTLLAYGVPPEWLDDVRQATEDSVLDVADHLPGEAAEALLELAIGGTPAFPVHTPPDTDPFDHPDAQRRFRLMANEPELRRALEFPWEKWVVFLHPSQRAIVEREYSGPARVSGSAGTGKTVVALHRSMHLAQKYPGDTVVLTTFSRVLARLLHEKLQLLTTDQPDLADRIRVRAMDDIGFDLYEASLGKPRIATSSMIRSLLEQVAGTVEGHRFSIEFLEAEWIEVVDAWQLQTWEEYRDVQRLGRKTRLGPKQREVLWTMFEDVRARLSRQGLITTPDILAKAGAMVVDGGNTGYDHIVVDESQDIGVPQLRLLAALGGGQNEGLFFSGDLGQRIFQTPFSWLGLGVDVRGRSHTLKVNYRNSHQIRQYADRLLPPEMADVDGLSDARTGTVSAFGGPAPLVRVEASQDAECSAVASWIQARLAEHIHPHEIAILVRSQIELERAYAVAQAAGLEYERLDGTTLGAQDRLAVSTMHESKGLEFRAVAAMACDDEILPLQSRIEKIVDDGDLEDVYNTERNLLYVACTRARDHLLVAGVAPASEFLDDLTSTFVGSHG